MKTIFETIKVYCCNYQLKHTYKFTYYEPTEELKKYPVADYDNV